MDSTISLRSESQIMHSWEPKELPLVSVICITYNHKDSIKEAIEQILVQETPFAFEVIIHDDASTDGTVSIIEHYSEKYPQIIKPIYQNENQFSKGKNPLLLAVDHAQGHYLALCEGDDFWIDSKKLHHQLREMKKHPECHISFHPAYIKHNGPNNPTQLLGYHGPKTSIFTPSQLILGGGGFCPTASLVLKKQVCENFRLWFQESNVQDYLIQVLASLNGGALYLSTPMAVYQENSPGSWSEKMSQNPDYFYSFYKNRLTFLNHLDAYTQKRYHKIITIRKQQICHYVCRKPFIYPLRKKALLQENKLFNNPINRLLFYLLYKNNDLCNILHTLKRRCQFRPKSA